MLYDYTHICLHMFVIYIHIYVFTHLRCLQGITVLVWQYQCKSTLRLSVSQAYVNMALFENFTYAGIDATAEEA